MVSLHERAKDLFLAALEQPAAQRHQFVVASCGEDTALRVEVESLLQFHEESQAGSAAGSTGTPSGADTPFKPGEVFAGRYRMITRIGRGGMGDVWRADDLVIETPVAIKLIHSAGASARQQIVNEVRLARQITHPAVCRVFDVGEADDRVFFSMELVEGEDLAMLMKRVGRLPSEKVIEIARQLCGGLAAAHARGVLHRDLKPANVLIDDEGRVRITDFGIAVPQTDVSQHTLIGTPGYMAPEQLTPGAALSERTDLYALGLILYELVVGQHPFNWTAKSGTPSRPSVRVPDVNASLERLILQALAPDPKARPSSAEAMLAGLPVAPAPKRRLSRASLAGLLVALVLGAAAVGWTFLSRSGGRPLTGQDTILLADFTNTTGEPVFDGALKVALAVALEQSPFLRVFPDERIRETLRLMGRPPDTPLTRPVAREIAQREQIAAVLGGSIAGLGRNFVLTLEALNTDTGDVIAREQVEATSKEEVLTALGAAASGLRGKLGESLASIQKFDVPLARATTPSLEALHSYSLALDNGRVSPRLEAIAPLRRALELDPNFALALAQLAGTYANTGQTSLAPEYARRAFELRDRVSERERFFIAFRYYRDASQDWTQALELSRSWTVTYPREAFAFNSLGTALMRFGRFEQAIAPLREGIRLDPRFEVPYANLAGALLALGRFDDARAVLREEEAQQLSSFPSRRMSYLLAFLEGDTATMNRMLEASIGVGQTNAAHGWQGHTVAFGGEIKGAHEWFRRGMQMAIQSGFTEVAGNLAVEDAEVHAVVGQCTEARSEVAGGLAYSRDNFTLERASRALALCGFESESTQVIQELMRRYPDATFTQRVVVPVTQAVTSLHKGDARRTLQLLEPLGTFDRAQRSEFWIEYLRGQAYLRLRDGAGAAEQFRSILAHRGEYANAVVYPFAYLGLGRALTQAGDLPAARQAYLDFLRIWKAADPDLQPLTEARQEYERLQ
jgi:Flp pilus assembly protein TadD